MALSEEEYKNIWLRFKDNMEGWINRRLLFWFTLLTLISAFGIHNYISKYIDKVLEEKVTQTLNSKDFSDKLITSTLNRLDKVKEEEKNLNMKLTNLETEIFKLSNKMSDISRITSKFPFKIDDSSITFISDDKSLFIIEKGSLEVKPSFKSKDIFFNKSFKHVPVVLATECSVESKNPLNKTFTEIVIHSVTKNKFSVFPTNKRFRNTELCWLAIGN